MIYINNLKHLSHSTKTQVRVDRSSVLGNPFEMLMESERDKVCEAFQEYFDLVMRGHNPSLKEIAEKYQVRLSGKYKGSPELIRLRIRDLTTQYLRDKNLSLMCWCKPKRCHATTIKNYLEKELIAVK